MRRTIGLVASLWAALSVVLVLTASRAYASDAVSLGVAVLNQDPSIRVLPVVPIVAAQTPSPEINPGYGSQFERIRARMHTHSGTATDASALAIYQAAQKLLPGVLAKLKARGILDAINSVARLYQIDPLHLLGPIAVEGVYNANTLNLVQDFSARVLQAAGSRSFASTWLDGPQVAKCRALTNVYIRWNCTIEKWGAQVFTLGGSLSPSLAVKSPIYQSYGIAQFSPIRAIMMTEILQRISKFPPMDDTDVGAAFGIVLDQTKTVHAIAANAVMVMAAYRRIAGFELSQRPDLTATLYNVGFEVDRAKALSVRRLATPDAKPENNYFGYFVRANAATLRAALRAR